ncbi:hypothetical protein [Gillisia sp. Hel_I_29]|uniref:hypothetical protein n=1 Tax=Gillisia sp. Hel_I_29 TaxID=1249975 RepID=UPI00054F3F33|nr:hypothetical protein [Gillisia sp. Hel_I_29]
MTGKLLIGINAYLKRQSDKTITKITDIFLIAVFGSRKKAENFIQEIIRENSTDKQREQQIKKSLSYHTIKKFLTVFEGIDSVSELFRRINEIKNGSFKTGLTTNEINTLYKIYKNFDLEIRNISGEDFESSGIFDLNKIINNIAPQITFSIKDTREELEMRDNRTFKKWLKFFNLNLSKNEDNTFKKKFNLMEYLNIWNNFVLKHFKDKDGSFKNLDQLEEVFQTGLVLTKGDLKEFTKGKDYRQLWSHLDSLQIPNNINLFPYAIFIRLRSSIEADRENKSY